MSVSQGQTSDTAGEEFIGTVDVAELHAIRWWFLQFLARRYVEEMELGRPLRGLLATRNWSVVRVVPHVDERGAPSAHVFDVYGVPAQPNARLRQTPA
jgi:hypothetical protein